MVIRPVNQRSEEAVTLLRGTCYASGPDTAAHGTLRIVAGKLQPIDAGVTNLRTTETQIDLDGFLLLPGLINAHDHLQYALHPRLGHPPYRNYVEWGDDIHTTLQSLISHHNSVPRDVRLWWGGIRNLLCGVTTVCHHNPIWPGLRDHNFPVRVVTEFGWAHSVPLEPQLSAKFVATPKGQPF